MTPATATAAAAATATANAHRYSGPLQGGCRPSRGLKLATTNDDDASVCSWAALVVRPGLDVELRTSSLELSLLQSSAAARPAPPCTTPPVWLAPKVSQSARSLSNVHSSPPPPRPPPPPAPFRRPPAAIAEPASASPLPPPSSRADCLDD
ncbi:60s ribosomal protein L24 [Moesziomyces antarcticus T-34]|uniref:60s ribosomal protein L24 n=1 Tax=Pseudozyma antarctica (strain T-34) TaxID=1151754 RepID=M9LT34_PSEA3|nr:60s ribosomal protein L24 [Moesziomyces antarcticus T-34]